VSGSQVEFRVVSKTYGERQVLNAVSFIIPTSAPMAILGPSGCGKSTVLRLLAGLDAPSAGEVLLDGQVVSQPNKVVKPPHQRGIAMMFQDLALWPNLSARDNVLLGLSGIGLPRQEAQRRTNEALALCAIQSLADRKPGTLSGGEQQRVALARAIAVQPAYLLLDEPFSGLDLVTKTTLLEEIANLVVERKLTIVLVTHDPKEALVLCRSALVLNQGRIEEAGLFTDLLNAPQSEILQIFRAHDGSLRGG